MKKHILKKKIITKLLVAGAFIFGLTINSFAAEIIPVSYSFDKATDCGSYCYHDETGNQLTDGNYGVAPWWANLGNGNAYEWVGWVWDNPINIDFNFGTTTSVNSIIVGSVQDSLGDVVLPNVAIYSSPDNISWSFVNQLNVTPSSFNNNTHMTYGFGPLSINSQYVRVQVINNQPWAFIDEVDFYGNPHNVPEPSTLLLLGGGLAGLMLGRKKFSKV